MFLVYNWEVFPKYAISALKSIFVTSYGAWTTLGLAMRTGVQFSLSSVLHRKEEEPTYPLGRVHRVPEAQINFREPGQSFILKSGGRK